MSFGIDLQLPKTLLNPLDTVGGRLRSPSDREHFTTMSIQILAGQRDRMVRGFRGFALPGVEHPQGR